MWQRPLRPPGGQCAGAPHPPVSHIPAKAMLWHAAGCRCVSLGGACRTPGWGMPPACKPVQRGAPAAGRGAPVHDAGRAAERACAAAPFMAAPWVGCSGCTGIQAGWQRLQPAAVRSRMWTLLTRSCCWRLPAAADRADSLRRMQSYLGGFGTLTQLPTAVCPPSPPPPPVAPPPPVIPVPSPGGGSGISGGAIAGEVPLPHAPGRWLPLPSCPNRAGQASSGLLWRAMYSPCMRGLLCGLSRS